MCVGKSKIPVTYQLANASGWTMGGFNGMLVIKMLEVHVIHVLHVVLASSGCLFENSIVLY